MDYSPRGSPIHGISQARILEWVAISFYGGTSWTRNQTCISCIGRQILYHRAIRKPTLNNELFSSVQLLSCVQLFMTPWTIACQTSQSITNFWSLLKLMSIQSVMSSNQFTLCHPLFLPPSILPSIMVFPMSQFFASGGQSIGVSASASVLPMNIQDWFPLGLTGWMSLLSKEL